MQTEKGEHEAERGAKKDREEAEAEKEERRAPEQRVAVGVEQSQSRHLSTSYLASRMCGSPDSLARTGSWT